MFRSTCILRNIITRTYLAAPSRYYQQSTCDKLTHPHIRVILKAFTFCSLDLCSRFVLPAYSCHQGTSLCRTGTSRFSDGSDSTLKGGGQKLRPRPNILNRPSSKIFQKISYLITHKHYVIYITPCQSGPCPIFCRHDKSYFKSPLRGRQ